MKFTGTIDLGDAQQIHAISGKYSLYVVLADRSLSEMIQQKVATVQIKFATETNIPQILDSSLPKIEEIYPTFYPAKPYSFIINVIMAALIVLVTLSILRVMANQPWNTNMFPQESHKVLYNYAFWVAVI